MDRIFNDPTRRLRNFKVTPGDKPASAEELCAEINKAMDEAERRGRSDDPPRTNKPKVDLRDLVKSL